MSKSPGIYKVLGQNGRGQNGTDKMVGTKWYRIESSINPAIQLPLTIRFLH